MNIWNVDYNRAGVTLIEIVTEPDLHNGDETAAYLTELRKNGSLTLQVCDGNMDEEGSMRCDANISIKAERWSAAGYQSGSENLNSIRYLKKAIDYEVMRMIEMKEKELYSNQTHTSFNADDGNNFLHSHKRKRTTTVILQILDLPPL